MCELGTEHILSFILCSIMTSWQHLRKGDKCLEEVLESSFSKTDD